MNTIQFQKLIYAYYLKNKRSFPWRETTDPYAILVSEFMLQQTQTDRVVPKYNLFIKTFPDFAALADAKQSDVLALWSGLGYNRRALYLHKTAQHVSNVFNDQLPNDLKTLQTLPGIGPYTAAAILAFAFNKPTIVIETNIRTVYIHHFFADHLEVHDSEIMPIIKDTLDLKNPKEWYYALMDYGVYLKNIHPNPNRKSRHYTKQSKFEGSDRQLRGAIVRMILQDKEINFDAINDQLNEDPMRVTKILDSLAKEGFVTNNNGIIVLKD